MCPRDPKSSFGNPRSYYVKGSYNVWCPVCDGTFKREDTRIRWDGVLTCNKCWDPYHPQNRTSPVSSTEGAAVRDPRPEPAEDTFGEGVEGDF